MSPEQKQTIVQLVLRDSGLTTEQKALVLSKITEENLLDRVSGGIIGGGVGLIISKFLNMTPRSQILTTLAGFGIGRYLLDVSQKHDNFIRYNDKLKTYEIQK